MNDDKDLHNEKISALYRQLPDEAPSSDTDALIRATARRAVSARPKTGIFTGRIQALLATAATMVLGVALLAQWQREPEKLQDMMATAPSPSTAPAAARVQETPATLPSTPELARPETVVTLEKQKTRAALNAEKPSKPASAAPATSSAGAVAAAPAPVPAQEGMEVPNAFAREAEENSVVADSVARAEARNAPTRQQTIARAQADDAAKKKAAAAPALRLAAKHEGMARDDADPAWNAYQQAMQAGDWLQAEIAMGAARSDEPPQQQTDRQLLAQLQKKPRPHACTGLPSREELLCRIITLHAAGTPLPADALVQLESSGAISGTLSYRRPAVMKLLEQP